MFGSESSKAAVKVLARLWAFLELRILFQTDVVVGRIQFLVVVEPVFLLAAHWGPLSAPTGHLQFLAMWPLTI